MKGYDYSVLKERKIYNIVLPLGKLVYGAKYKVKFTGLENIPAEGGFILASNHMCAIDPIMLAVGCGKRQLHFMGKKELFENPFVKKILTLVNGFPVARGSADTKALKYAARVVNEGYILGMFPEGTRSKDHKPARAKSGISLIAYEAKANVLPVAIYNDEDMKSGTKVTIRFGEMIPYESLGLTDGSKEEFKATSKFIMDEIVKLWEMGHCE